MSNTRIKTSYLMMLLASLFVSSNVNASILTINDYTLNTDTNIVSKGQLQWLQWDQTVGLSIDHALLLNDGWQLATTSNVASLFNDFFGASSWSTNENQESTFGLEASENDQAFKDFVALFGFTARSYDSSATTFFDHYYGVNALFGDDLDMDGYFQKASARDAYLYNHSGEEFAVGAYASMTGDEYTKDYSNAYSGVALVRANNPNVVPEPSGIFIILLGLIYFAFLNPKHDAYNPRK